MPWPAEIQCYSLAEKEKFKIHRAQLPYFLASFVDVERDKHPKLIKASL